MTPDAFICTLLCAAQRAHELHLSTTSFADHEALGKLYEDLPGAIDDLAEVYMGLEGQRLELGKPGGVDECIEADEPAEFVEGLQECIEGNRAVLGDRSAVQNAVDEVLAIVGRARYRLENLT